MRRRAAKHVLNRRTSAVPHTRPVKSNTAALTYIYIQKHYNILMLAGHVVPVFHDLCDALIEDRASKTNSPQALVVQW